MRLINSYAESSSFIVGVVFTSLALCGVLFIGFFIYLSSNNVFLNESELAIQAEAGRLKLLFDQKGKQSLVSFIRSKREVEPNFFYFIQSNGSDEISNIQVMTSNVPEEPSIENTGFYLSSIVIKSTYEGELDKGTGNNTGKYNSVEVLGKWFELGLNERILIARDVSIINTAQWVTKSFGWLVIIILIAIPSISFLVAHYVVSRINRITETTDNIIQTGELSERLPVDSTWDDLSKLSNALNHLLEELERMVYAVKSISDNVAHDLRTPITRLKTKIEGLKDTNEQRGLLDEVDNLLGIFNSLLRIAEVEAQRRKEAFETVDLSLMVQDVIELYSPLIEDKGISLIWRCPEESSQVLCDKHLIFQALSNILDNAVKYTSSGDEIRVILDSRKGQCCISICDTGPGVLESDLERMTERFFRCDQSRSLPGNGLGLALVKAVAELHEGKFEMKNGAVSGLCCNLYLNAK